MFHQAMMAGPMMAAAMMPTQMMMASANPYLNPLHPLHPFEHDFNVNHHYMTPGGMTTYNASVPSFGGGSSSDYDDDEDLHFGHPFIKVKTHCHNVNLQALEIANNMLKKQNHFLFKRVMKYLLQSKYSIGTTEIKLTRKLRRNIFAIMQGFSTIADNNVRFSPIGDLDEGVSEDSDSATNQSLDSSEIGMDDSYENSSQMGVDHLDN